MTIKVQVVRKGSVPANGDFFVDHIKGRFTRMRGFGKPVIGMHVIMVAMVTRFKHSDRF